MSKWKSSCPPPEIEAGPYPSNEWLDAFEKWCPTGAEDARLFIAFDLPFLFEELLHPYGYAKSIEDKDGKHHVYLATGGWSGCEEIYSILDSGAGKIWFWMFWSMSARGGARWYETHKRKEIEG